MENTKIESAPEIVKALVDEKTISKMFGIPVTFLQKDRTHKSIINKTNKFPFTKVGASVSGHC